MKAEKINKQKILIVDDSEINRIILSNMLETEYEIIEATDGLEGIEQLHNYGNEISLVLLDIVMPNVDGFGVLKVMNEYRWIEDIPVIMISAENSHLSIEKAYELGVTDFISRPFDALIVHHRVINTIMLYDKQKKLTDIIMEQIYEKEKSNSLMISILSHVVEFRNGESGLHVININRITEILLEHLVKKTQKYNLSNADISLISMASSLHDIGKIAIPEEILNKPGKLTKEEFDTMKTHSAIGASMLEDIDFYQDEPLVKIAYEICRWHHERYDGKGYPDGLKGEEIPISAQIVSIADVYDALTSKRVYKAAFSHDKAIDMIVNGECGTFNPLLIECLLEVGDKIRLDIEANSISSLSQKNLQKSVADIMDYEELSSSDRLVRLLEHERMKYRILAMMSDEIQFEYKSNPSILTISDWGAERLGLSENIMNPLQDSSIKKILDEDGLKTIIKTVKQITKNKPINDCLVKVKVGGEWKWHEFICQKVENVDELLPVADMIGKLVDVDEKYRKWRID